MGLCGFIQYTFVLACCWFCVHSFGGQDGSQSTSKRCDCDFVEVWLPRRKNGASKLLSLEANRPSYELISKDSFKRLRLWLPKHCELLFDKSKSLQENAQSHPQNVADGSVEVLLNDQLLDSCTTAALLKCKERILCVGIDAGKQGTVDFTQRKLLMFKSDSSKDTFTHQPYGVLLSILLFCSMVALLALCGKAERKNSEESVAHDSSSHVVKMVSSEKVKNAPSRSVAMDTEKDVHEAKPETIEIKVEGSRDLTTERNSNKATQPGADDDMRKDGGISRVDGGVFGKEKISGHNGIRSEKEKVADEGQNAKEDLENEIGESLEEMERKNGNSFGEKRRNRPNEANEGKKGKRNDDKDKEKHEKRKEKEDKRKEKEREKEVKHKERSKDLKTKRSHTAPPERPEPRPLPKTSLSVKTSSTTTYTSDERKTSKKEKKKSKRHNIDSPPTSPPPFAGATNRNSFINRQLPKTPSQDLDTDDGDYEQVMPAGRPRDPNKLMVPTGNPRTSASCDSDVYDSVDDVKVPNGSTAGDDTYETVDTKRAKSMESNDKPTTELYESVTGEYEYPKLHKKRSYSDISPGSSSPRPDAERKPMSLDRKTYRENAPTPPPLDHLKFAAQSHKWEQLAVDTINPYTVTFKKGDRIIQEANITDEHRLPRNRHEEETLLSEEEIAELYTKVDREKQKKDREEEKNRETKNDGGIEEERADNGGVVSLSAVGVEEHQYESMRGKEDLSHQTEDLALYDEVETKEAPNKHEQVFV